MAGFGVLAYRNRSQAGDWLIFPAINRRRADGRRVSRDGSPGKMCLSPWLLQEDAVSGP